MMTTKIADYQPAQEIFSSIGVGILTTIDLSFKLILDFVEQFLIYDWRIESWNGDWFSRATALKAVVIQNPDIGPVTQGSCNEGHTEAMPLVCPIPSVIQRLGNGLMPVTLIVEIEDALDNGRSLFVNDGMADNADALLTLLRFNNFFFVAKWRAEN